MYLMCNKGESETKCHKVNYAKLIARGDDELQKVKFTSVGINRARNTIVSGVVGEDRDLCLYDLLNFDN